MKARIKSTGEIVEVKPCKDLIEVEMYEDENGTRHFPFQLEFGKEPDWEQRRYEIAKDILVRLITHEDGCIRNEWSRMKEQYISDAIEAADVIIEGLKKTNYD